jgi:hypothetical protein
MRCSIHAGKKQNSLLVLYAKVIKLYSGRTAAKNSKTFTWEFQSPDTVLFELSPV